ncbi:MAG: PhzF family phenazine biosynthesis protein [Candidatus Aminicenantaceae bacterium]
MGKKCFYIVDVFSEKKYAGNQLAVFKDAQDLSEAEMQQIAREMNFSETTFILSEEPHDGGYDVRIFTPRMELPFAGHPTLGTAFIIQQEIVPHRAETVILNLKVGQIPVSLNYTNNKIDNLWMKQIAPIFGPTHNREKLADVLSIEKDDILDHFPVQEVSTGVYCFIVPLRTLDAVKRTQILREKYFKFIENTQAKGILIFSPETYSKKNDLNVRFFDDYVGVPEDPATGSANGCLCGYLVKHRYFGDEKIDIRVEQGYEMKRPSLLFLRGEEKEGKIDVFVGGKVIMIAQGEFV